MEINKQAALFSLVAMPLLNALVLRVCTNKPPFYCEEASLASSPLLHLLRALFKSNTETSVTLLIPSTLITLLNYFSVQALLTDSSSSKVVCGAALATSAICYYFLTREVLYKICPDVHRDNVARNVAVNQSNERSQQEFEVAPVRHQHDRAAVQELDPHNKKERRL